MSIESNGSNGNVKQRAAVWVAVVFVLGALLGSVSGYLFASHSHADMKPVLSDDERRAQKVSVLTKDLNLTPDQQTKLDATIREAQTKFKAIREASQPQIEAARAEARANVRAFLTADQLPKYEQYLQKIDAARKRTGKP